MLVTLAQYAPDSVVIYTYVVVSVAGSTRVCGDDVRAGAYLEGERGRQLEWIDGNSVEIRRHAGRCLPRLPGCTCSREVRPHSTAAVSRSRPR